MADLFIACAVFQLKSLSKHLPVCAVCCHLHTSHLEESDARLDVSESLDGRAFCVPHARSICGSISTRHLRRNAACAHPGPKLNQAHLKANCATHKEPCGEPLALAASWPSMSNHLRLEWKTSGFAACQNLCFQCEASSNIFTCPVGCCCNGSTRVTCCTTEPVPPAQVAARGTTAQNPSEKHISAEKTEIPREKVPFRIFGAFPRHVTLTAIACSSHWSHVMFRTRHQEGLWEKNAEYLLQKHVACCTDALDAEPQALPDPQPSCSCRLRIPQLNIIILAVLAHRSPVNNSLHQVFI